RYALTADGDVPRIDVCPVGEPGTAFLILGTYPPIHLTESMAAFETENMDSRGSVTVRSRGGGGVGMSFDFGSTGTGSIGGGAGYIPRRSKRSWCLLGGRVFLEGVNQRRIDMWVDGSFHGTYFENHSLGGWPTVLRRIRHMITRTISFSQIGVYE